MMNSIRRASKAYNSAVTPGAEGMQEALMKLVGKAPLGQVANRGSGMPGQSMLVGNLDRMAASDEMLALLKALPAAAVVGGGLGASELVTGDDSFANKGMDLLGMGGGMYGMAHAPYGVGGTTNAGRALRYTGGAMAGKLGSDLIQYLGGGGQSTTDRQILEALENLGGGRG